MPRVDRPHENAITTGAPQDCSHRSRIETQSAYGSSGAARLALNLCGRDLNSEDVLKKTCGSIAIQNEIRVILGHGDYPPVGPKRSVQRGRRPSLKACLAA